MKPSLSCSFSGPLPAPMAFVGERQAGDNGCDESPDHCMLTTNFLSHARKTRAVEVKQSACQRFFGVLFRSRGPVCGVLHRNAAEGCTALRKPVQKTLGVRALTGPDEVILSNPDDRLESAGQDNCRTRDARAGSVQRIARTARRESAALPAGHHLRFPAQRPGARVCRASRRGRLRRFRADHRRRPHAHPELHRQVRAGIAGALRRRVSASCARSRAVPNPRARCACSGSSRASKPPNPPPTA